jgi:glycosyltransferase involved in cell wall biosynthesis
MTFPAHSPETNRERAPAPDKFREPGEHQQEAKTVPKKRICHVIHQDGAGGGPVTVIDHITYFADCFQLLVLHGGTGGIARACKTLSISHRRIALDRISRVPIGFTQLLYYFRRFRPDLVMLHGQWAAPVGALAARLCGIKKIVYICHWPAFYTDWDLRRVIRNHLCEAIPSRLASRVITLSESNYYQYLIRTCVPEGRLLSIPNPIDIENLPAPEEASGIRAQYGWTNDICHIVSVGRLSTQKRLDWLLRSWAAVIRKTSRAKLWIVGDGELEHELKRLAEALQLGDSCIFLGSRPRGVSFVAASDVVAFTSLYEALGNVALEAMACGKPIVASQVDGIRDSYRDGREGFLVPPGDIQLFAERLIRLIEEPPLRRKMGEAGKATAREFAKPLIMPRYRSVIDSVLAEP